MKVLFDVNSMIKQKTGVGHFTERLLVNLSQSHIDDYEITAYYFNFLGRNKISPLPRRSNILYKEIRFMPSKLLSFFHRLGLQLPIEFFLGFGNYDFAIFPNFVSMPSLKKLPSFVAIHDVSFIDCPQYTQDANKRYLVKFVPRTIKRASGIITISRFTKTRIQKHYRVNSNKIVVLPIPYEINRLEGAISKPTRDIAKSKFVLFVGTIEPRKNIDGLVNGFAQLPLVIRKSYSLVLAGAIGWKTEKTIKAITDTNKDITCITTGYITDAERDFLYKHATTVCLLSHYEGFGMPILEAAHYKKPLVLNSIDVFKEIAGASAYYCDATNPKDVARAIEESIHATSPHLVDTTYSWQDNINSFDAFVYLRIKNQ